MCLVRRFLQSKFLFECQQQPPYVKPWNPFAHNSQNLNAVQDHLQIPLFPQDVPVVREMHDMLPQMKFDDYDLATEVTFPELAPENYLEGVLYDNVLKVESMPWVCILHNAGVLNLIRIPYFGKYPITSLCVRQFLTLVHDGTLWIQGRIPIDVALIHRITDLPMRGSHLMKGFGKSTKLKVANEVKETYAVKCDKWVFLVQTINNQLVRVGTLVLECKIMRKFQPKTVSTHVISLAVKYEKGVLYNWSQFLYEQLLQNVRESQEMGKPF